MRYLGWVLDQLRRRKAKGRSPLCAWRASLGVVLFFFLGGGTRGVWRAWCVHAPFHAQRRLACPLLPNANTEAEAVAGLPVSEEAPPAGAFPPVAGVA
jgi:hypothetical protein